MKKTRPFLPYVFVASGVVFLLGLWAIVAAILKSQGNMVILYPHESFARVFEFLFLDGAAKTWTAIGWTTLRFVIGFVISFVLGSLLGSLAGLHQWFKHFMKPTLGVMKTIPTAAVVILIVATVYGPKNAHLITYVPCLLIFIVAFPLIFEAFRTALENENPSVLASLDLDGGRRSWMALTKVLWPDAFAYARLSIAQSLGLSMKVCIMSEVLSATSASKPSVGGLISNAQSSGAVEDILPLAIIALLLMLVIDIPFFVLRNRKAK